jgi:transcriptional regulator with XRE-family HTH domain
MKGHIAPEQLEATRQLVGTWLRDKRERKGLSQAALANLMGIRFETVSKVEAGKWAISVDMLALFCEHLECPLDQIFIVETSTVDLDQENNN